MSFLFLVWLRIFKCCILTSCEQNYPFELKQVKTSQREQRVKLMETQNQFQTHFWHDENNICAVFKAV